MPCSVQNKRLLCFIGSKDGLAVHSVCIIDRLRDLFDLDVPDVSQVDDEDSRLASLDKLFSRYGIVFVSIERLVFAVPVWWMLFCYVG